MPQYQPRRRRPMGGLTRHNPLPIPPLAPIRGHFFWYKKIVQGISPGRNKGERTMANFNPAGTPGCPLCGGLGYRQVVDQYDDACQCHRGRVLDGQDPNDPATCGTCRHWKRQDPDSDWGDCQVQGDIARSSAVECVCLTGRHEKGTPQE